MQYKLSYYFFKLQIFYTYSSFFHKFQLLLNSQILHVYHIILKFYLFDIYINVIQIMMSTILPNFLFNYDSIQF